MSPEDEDLTPEERAELARQDYEDGLCWAEEQRNGSLHGRNVL